MTKEARLETRVQDLEGKVKALTKEWDRRFEKRLEERVRAEGEMMDERFANLYAYMDKRFDRVHNELKVLREGMQVVLSKLA